MRKFEITWSERNFCLTFYGQVTLEDLMRANDHIIASRNMYQLDYYTIDFRHVERLDLSERELMIFAKYDSVMPRFLRHSTIKGALLTTCSTIEKQLSHFLANGHTSWPRKIFHGESPEPNWVPPCSTSSSCINN